MFSLIGLFHILVFPGLLFCAFSGLLIAGVDRRVVARMQRRYGPPIRQPWYDFMKLMGKETIVPASAARGVFLAAPAVALASAASVALFIPVFGFTLLNGVADLVVILYLLTLSAVALIVGGASSGSPYAGVGVSRAVVVLMSYELPLVLVILAVGRAAGESSVTFSLAQIAAFQTAHGPLIADMRLWPAAFAMLLVIPCEVGSAPFDAAEAGTELCEGPLVEYGGRPLALFKLAHAIKQYVMAALFIALFFGGALSGYLLLDAVILLLGAVGVTLVSTTFTRAICGRLRIEQLFRFYWTAVSLCALASLLLVWFL